MYYYAIHQTVIQCLNHEPQLASYQVEEPVFGWPVVMGKHLGYGVYRDRIPHTKGGVPRKGVMALMSEGCSAEDPIGWVNLDMPQLIQSFSEKPQKLRVNLLGLGDVGAHVLIGLKLMGGEILESIGIYDLNEKQVSRYCIEVNQIFSEGLVGDIAVYPIDKASLFDCDVFIFTASAFVPAIGEEQVDVRMAQFESNAKLVSHYARSAREANFSGLFFVVSDPVDLLCQCVYDESNQNEAGIVDGKGLSNSQIYGFGLGVMHARARYYAKKDPTLCSYLTEGAIFGPHGVDLLVLNSFLQYDAALSERLTHLTTTANLEVRKLGYKPFIAPAYSSAALSMLSFLKGEDAHVASYLDGMFFGAKCRLTPGGIVFQTIPYHPLIAEKLKASYSALLSLYKGRQHD